MIKNNIIGQIKWEQMVFEGNPEFGIYLCSRSFRRFCGELRSSGIYDRTARKRRRTFVRQALARAGPQLCQAVVDPNEPPLPGNVNTDQFIKFSEALLKGQRDGWKILKTVLKDKIREVA